MNVKKNCSIFLIAHTPKNITIENKTLYMKNISKYLPIVFRCETKKSLKKKNKSQSKMTKKNVVSCFQPWIILFILIISVKTKKMMGNYFWTKKLKKKSTKKKNHSNK